MKISSAGKQAEYEFTAEYERVYRVVNYAFDVRGSLLAFFIGDALDNRGVVRPEIRIKYADKAPLAFFDLLEKTAKAEFTKT